MTSARAYADAGKRFRRPLYLSVGTSVLGELAIFVIFGVFLYPEGSLVTKFLWTVVFCGVGMGSAVGSALALFVVDRLDGAKAIAASVGLSVLLLGVACDLLCLSLDQHFEFFGGHDTPTLFLANGIAMSAVGGFAIGLLLFTARGNRLLDRAGL